MAKELTLVEILEMIKESKIYLLKYQGKVLGLRVKIYNKDTTDYDFYDIGLEVVSNNQEVKDFVNKTQKSFGIMDLISYNGGLATEDEISGKVQVRSFPSTEEAVAVLTKLMAVYGYKYVIPNQ